VADLMTRKRDLMALDLNEVETSSIGDVVNLLKDNSQQHCLVVDDKTHQIRGIFSASDISRKLHLPINIQEQSSFYRVFAAVS
jgi:CBS-domain-containing membrane protein